MRGVRIKASINEHKNTQKIQDLYLELQKKNEELTKENEILKKENEELKNTIIKSVKDGVK